MSLGHTHEMWRDSVPVTSFPFRYHDRQHGTISQTWAEVKDKLGRDAQSQALPFSPAHIAPSQLHSNIIAAINRKEEQGSKRLEQLRRVRAAASRPSSAPASRRGGGAGPTRAPQTTSEVMSQLVAKTSSASPKQPAPSAVAEDTAPPPVVVKPQRPMSAVERRVLTEGNGDGVRGRQAYLRLRRRLPLQHRTNYRRTSSQSYGWELLDFTDAATAPQQQEAALMQAVGHASAAVPKRPAPGGIAAEAATVSAAAEAANRRSRPVPEFSKAAVGSAASAAPAAVAARQQAQAASADGVGTKQHATATAAAAATAADVPMKVTPLGTMVRAHASGQREPGQAEYFGRRSYMNQLARRTGVFSRGDV